MKLFYFIVLISILFTILPERSFSIVESSPHDMIAQEFFSRDEVTDRTNCSYCHLSFKEPGNKIWKNMPPSLVGFGNVGPFCYSCHDGVTVVDFNVDASRTAFSLKSHGLSLKNLPSGDTVENVPLKHVKENNMECTTCHDVHNNENRPFLAVPLKEMCGLCHQSRRNTGFGINNIEGNHPVGVSPTDSTGEPSPINVVDIFKTSYPQPYPIKGGKFFENVHWDLGGHLTNGLHGNIECYTCHAVHGNEITGPNARLMTVDPVRKINDAFCESCHRGVRGDTVEPGKAFPNPGGTTEARTYHPADDDDANGIDRIVEITEPKDWPFGITEPKNVICSTCHDVHNSFKNSPILRKMSGDTFCEECHNKELQGHHLSGSLSNPKNIILRTTEYKWSYEIESQWDNGNPKIKLEADKASNGYGMTFGNKVENRIYCSSCHKAHNAGNGIQNKATPSLIISHTANQLCFLCHFPDNIAFNPDPEYTASHFMGDPTREDTYDKEPEEVLFNKEEWPETKLKSKYGGANNFEIICETCHSFSKKNMNAPEYSYYNNKVMLIARADEKIEWIPQEVQIDEGIVLPKDALPDPRFYLCIGCHGENPGSEEADEQEVSSHPMMEVDGLLRNGVKMELLATPPASYTKNLKVNCNSCHYAHNAATKGGVYMFKAVEGENTDPLAIHTKKDYTKFCSLCHKEQ